jgi:antitoxin component YwqK of YwqJK toxin-antitoxin module
MKPLLTILVFLFTAIAALGQQDYPDSGFTNKAEAKNLMVHEKKEGKWVEYFLEDGICIPTDTSAPYYALTIYKDGKRSGILRRYYKNGKLLAETWYIDDMRNGVEKAYYESGKLEEETTFMNDLRNGVCKMYYENGNIQSATPYSENKMNGMEKEYYENGNLKSEDPFSDGVPNGILKEYYESGKLKYEMIFNKGRLGATKNYDQTGNEIKQ